MKRILGIVMVAMLIVSSTCIVASAAEGNSLDDVISSAQSQSPETTQPNQGTEGAKKDNDHSNFVNGLNEAANLTPEVDGIAPVRDGIKLAASWIVQIVSYVIVAFMAVVIVCDLAYIAIPPLRSFLANGYGGNPQNGGQPGMGSPMNSGMGGMGGGYGGRYGGGYGMNGMNQMGGIGGMSGMTSQNAMINNQSNRTGRVQFVSNAALNAVASESAVGPDGKSMNPYKVYAKSMAVLLIVTPILITLAATGVLSQLGFLIADMLVDGIRNIGNLM